MAVQEIITKHYYSNHPAYRRKPAQAIRSTMLLPGDALV